MGAPRKGRALRAVIAVIAMASVNACEQTPEQLAQVGETAINIGEVATLHLDVDGRYWIGGAGGIAIVDTAGVVTPGMATRGTEAPRVVGSAAGALHIVHLDSLIAIDRETHERLGARAGFERLPVVSDRRGRFVAQGARSGAVLGFDPRSIEPLWGWGARGAVTNAMTMSPEADMIWQAIDGDGPRILRRDVQTGRIIASHEASAALHALTTTRNGDLLILAGDGERLELERVRPVGDELRPIWARTMRIDGDAAPRLLYRHGSPVVAVFRPGNEAGLHVFDVEAGTPLGSIDASALDAQISAGGVLHVLLPRAVRRYSAVLQ